MGVAEDLGVQTRRVWIPSWTGGLQSLCRNPWASSLAGQDGHLARQAPVCRPVNDHVQRSQVSNRRPFFVCIWQVHLGGKLTSNLIWRFGWEQTSKVWEVPHISAHHSLFLPTSSPSSHNRARAGQNAILFCSSLPVPPKTKSKRGLAHAKRRGRRPFAKPVPSCLG